MRFYLVMVILNGLSFTWQTTSDLAVAMANSGGWRRHCIPYQDAVTPRAGSGRVNVHGPGTVIVPGRK